MGGRSSLALFLTATLTFGTGFVGIKAGLAALPPLLFVALRYDLGAIVVLAYLVVRVGRWRPRVRADWLAILVGAVFLLGFNGAFLFLGVRSVTSGTAAVMYSLAPVIALAVLPSQRLDRVDVGGLALGSAGVIAVSGVGFGASGGAVVGRGPAFLLAAAGSVAVGSVLLRRLDAPLGSLAVTAWGMALAAVGLHAASLLVGEPQGIPVTASLAGAILWVGGPSTALAFPAYFGLIEQAGPVRANLITYAVPVVASITGVLILNEPIPLRTILGFAVIVGGFAVIERENLLGEYRRLTGRPADPTPTEHPCESMPRG